MSRRVVCALKLEEVVAEGAFCQSEDNHRTARDCNPPTYLSIRAVRMSPTPYTALYGLAMW